MVERLGRRVMWAVLGWDLALTLFALYSSAALRLWIKLGNPIQPQQVRIPWQLYGAAICIWGVVFLMFAPQRALFSDTVVDAIGQLLAAVALAVLAFAGVLYLSFRDISRLQFLYFAGTDLVLLLALHLIVRFYIRVPNRHGGERRTLIVGSGAYAQQLISEFERRPWVGIRVIGYASDDPVEHDGVPVLGPIGATECIVAEHAIDEVIFVTGHQNEVARISLELLKRPVMVHMVPSVLDLAFARTPVETLGGIPLISLRESALTESQRVLKRCFDVTGSLLLLLIFSPLLLLISLAIKLDSPGPVFLAQERLGEHGRRFKMIKFRTMYQDAEQQWPEVARRNASGHLVHKHADDPRVTRCGRKLRRTSLDELPQLINVLRGEMSLVGPRPELPYLLTEYAPWQWQRFRVPPGITGWWQVNGRSDKPMHLHTEDDLYYIQNYSFWLDLKILCMTVPAVMKGQGAF